MSMNVKKGDYLINDNGDVWLVESVHRDGSVTIFNNAGTGEDELTYSAGEIESWFRKLPADRDYSDIDYLDPKPYWGKTEEQTRRFHALQRKGAGVHKRSVHSSAARSVGGMR